MSHAPQYDQSLRPAAKIARLLGLSDWTLNQIDAVGLRYVGTLTVWGHWVILALVLFEVVYRPYYGMLRVAVYLLFPLLLAGYNGYLHYRIRTKGSITGTSLLALYVMDAVALSIAITLGAGFSHYFMHLFYYPALAGFAVVFTSLRLNLAWVTAVSLVYVTISLTVGDGLDYEARDEKALLARVAMMYAVVGVVNAASRFERMRFGQAVERERALERERIELSQTIHDTAAQSAYMIGLGIDTARSLAGNANPELTAMLDEMSRFSRSAIWELRHPINMGGIYEGRELNRALRSHASSFTNITSVPAELVQTGVEPPLSIETRGLLFSIAHNALTNAYRHAEASRVSVELNFGEGSLRLSVSDDGAGLPHDYAERGHGFTNMSRDAERLGGRLVVEERGAMGGATVTCVMPLDIG